MPRRSSEQNKTRPTEYPNTHSLEGIAYRALEDRDEDASQSASRSRSRGRRKHKAPGSRGCQRRCVCAMCYVPCVMCAPVPSVQCKPVSHLPTCKSLTGGFPPTSFPVVSFSSLQTTGTGNNRQRWAQQQPTAHIHMLNLSAMRDSLFSCPLGGVAAWYWCRRQ